MIFIRRIPQRQKPPAVHKHISRRHKEYDLYRDDSFCLSDLLQPAAQCSKKDRSPLPLLSRSPVPAAPRLSRDASTQSAPLLPLSAEPLPHPSEIPASSPFSHLNFNFIFKL